MTIHKYDGKVPACGVFCGGCPVYTREKRKCPGASNCDRCEKCKSFHLCCQSREIKHCYECKSFPCAKFKSFSKRWEKYGQVLLENQEMLSEMGEEKFIQHYNSKAEK